MQRHCNMLARLLLTSVLGLSLLGAKGEQLHKLDEFVHHFEPLYLKSNFSTISKDRLVSHFLFRAHGREFSVHVQTHTALFHPDFHVKVRGNEVLNKTMDTRHIVIGHVEGELDSAVHGHITNDTFNGAIISRGETYYVEPLTRYFPESPHFNQVIYKASDVVYDMEHSFCSSTESQKLRLIQESARHASHHSLSNLLRRRRREIDKDKNTCLIKVVADYEFFSAIGNSQESTTMDEMSDIIMQADAYYRSTNFIAEDGEEFSGFGIAIHSAEIITVNSQQENPFFGSFSVEELLDAFSVMDFDNVCLGHLFTYRDFNGILGLAYVGDPSGSRAGGICQKRTNTLVGQRNLNTGLTSLNNNGRRLPRSVTTITVAHEVGHNHGSEHDPAGECTPGGIQGNNYIMFPSATNGNQPNNRLFSPCSREAIGATILSSGSCFQPTPSTAVCGNGIVEGEEECDCGSDNETLCREVDPCCTPGNCTLLEGAICSAIVSSCCNASTCQAAMAGMPCLRGDDCQEDSTCQEGNPVCPVALRKDDGTSCNDGENVCEDGICVGSPCPLFNDSVACYCTEEPELCHVCCIFSNGDGSCTSTFDNPDVPKGIFVQSGYPCKNLTGYCRRDETDPDAIPVCATVDNDNPLDVLFNLSSIVEWIKGNWYWVLGGFAALVILIILLQITYRRKKPKDPQQRQQQWQQQHVLRRQRRQRNTPQTYGYYQTTTVEGEHGPLETSGLLPTDHMTTRT